MEKVILRLIELLGALLDFPNMWCDSIKDIKPEHDEVLQLLETKLPMLLEYCKSDYQRGNDIPPELDDLRALLGRVIDRGRYSINAFIDTTRELEEDIQTRPFLWQIADEGKSWLYWLNRYYPQEQPAPASQEPNPTAIELPSEIDTEQARKYFARAVEAGLMSEQFEWLATKAQLGYFCYKTYSQPRPLTALERFFDVKKLSSDITNASITAKRADVKKWRAKQDKEIFFL